MLLKKFVSSFGSLIFMGFNEKSQSTVGKFYPQIFFIIRYIGFNEPTRFELINTVFLSNY